MPVDKITGGLKMFKTIAYVINIFTNKPNAPDIKRSKKTSITLIIQHESDSEK